jgi:hypothetical protein
MSDAVRLKIGSLWSWLMAERQAAGVGGNRLLSIDGGQRQHRPGADLYYDESDNPKTAVRGITEVIVTKQRNGPVGTVKLLFEPQFTRFRNLASS